MGAKFKKTKRLKKEVNINKDQLAQREQQPEVIKTADTPIKYSQIFGDFIAPLLHMELDGDEELFRYVSWAVLIWNKAVADAHPEDSHMEELQNMFQQFIANHPNKQLINLMLERKKQLFNHHYFYIRDHKATINNGKLVITTTVDIIQPTDI